MIERVLLTSGEVKEQLLGDVYYILEPAVSVSLLMWQRLLIQILTQTDKKGF